jgi:apolipoprotein N-acyltransferase
VVDPLGRIVNSLPLGAEGVLDASLPRPIARTPYARMGDIPTGLMLVIAMAAVVRGRRRMAK